MTYNYETSTFSTKTQILKYPTAKYYNPLDYMRAVMAAIGEANRIAIIAA